MKNFEFDPENEIEVEKICKHIKRIIDKINKRSFNKIFKLEVNEMIHTSSDGFLYLIPFYLVEDLFVNIEYQGLGRFFEISYKDIIIIRSNERDESIMVGFTDNMNLGPFRSTIDMDDESFDLWFKLEYGG